jgi:hypothetical protein
MQISGFLHWDVEKLSGAMHLSKEDVIDYFKDGRRMSFILERRICKEVLDGKMPKSEGASFDIFDKEGGKWEVRCVTDTGTYFCPSSMIGAGRFFDEKGFLSKLEGIKGYILADITKFPLVEYWSTTSYEIIDLYVNKRIHHTTKVGRQRVIDLTKPTDQLTLF